MTDEVEMPGLFAGQFRKYAVGDECHIYMSRHQGETTPGKVVAVLDLPGWCITNYVVEVDVGAADPLLEVRCAVGMRSQAILPRGDADPWVGCCAPHVLPRPWWRRLWS